MGQAVAAPRATKSTGPAPIPVATVANQWRQKLPKTDNSRSKTQTMARISREIITKMKVAAAMVDISHQMPIPEAQTTTTTPTTMPVAAAAAATISTTITTIIRILTMAITITRVIKEVVTITMEQQLGVRVVPVGVIMGVVRV